MTESATQEASRLYDACRWDEAGVALELALKSAPDDAQAWYRLGNVRTEQGRDAEALACFWRALGLAPSYAKARNNLGAACERLGRQAEALEAYRRALETDPELFEPYLNLGRLHERLGEPARAAAYFRAGLERHPGHPMLAHLLTAVSGQTAPRAPREHVVAYFDGFAGQFDEHLVVRLGYRVPQALAELVCPLLAPGSPVLDLGCGTGLVGAALAGSDVRLVGVDLSPAMLDRARGRQVYAELVLGDIDDALRAAAPASYRAVVAADVFIYIGDLVGVFHEVARVLEPGGLFAFSVEGLRDGDYRLQSTGRYAHSLDYLRRLAAQNALHEKSVRALGLRVEKGGRIEGSLVMLERL